MRKNFIAVICILLTHNVYSQSFDYIDEKVKAYPEFYSTKKLARQINNDFSTELEKARAIYYWITHNIAYDFTAMRVTRQMLRKNNSRKKSSTRLQNEREKIIADYTIKERIGVCDGYATLYKQIGDLTNVHIEIVDGFTKVDEKDLGKIGSANHAWNAVLINKEWHLVDCTWGAGKYDYSLRKFVADFTNNYFMTRPELFFLNHYPSDKKWLLMEKTKLQFSDLPLYHTEYLDLGIDIKTPQKGIIEVAIGEMIHFEIEIPENLLFYRFEFVYKKDEYLQRMKFKESNNTGIASIQVPESFPDYLTIFYNQKPIVTYKIVAQISDDAAETGK